MKKLLLLFAVLLTSVGAWAQVSYTVSPTTGTGYNGTGFFKDWTFTTSDANPATLKFTVGANNMRVVNEQLELWVGSGSTYTLSVPMYYRIVSYSFDFVKESNYSDAVTLTVDGKDYAPTLETQTVTVSNVNATKASFKMSGANQGIKVSNFVVKIERFIELTTDPEKPKWYAIKNVRCGNYVYHNGDDGQMILRGLTGASRKAGKFYFTGEMNADGTEYTVKIHNAATTKLCAAYNSWTESGIDWYIKLSSNAANPGFAISTNTDYSGNETSWNDAEGKGTSVAYWNGGDPGSTWEFVSVSEYDFPEMSTIENPELYCIRNVRQYGKYANYVAEGSALTQVATPGYGSYWYFVAAEETAPEGWVACKIYNAANATSLKNPDGTFGDQVYYIKKHEWSNNIGFAIKRSTGTAWDGWNDKEGSTVVDYDADDAGSIWWIEKAPKTAATLKSEAATAKTNALNDIARYEFADYYTYSDEAIATAKAIINAANTDDVAAAVSGHMRIEQALATLRSTDKGTEGPKVGDFIRIKNKEGRGYMKHVTGETLILGTDDASEISSGVVVWAVESAGDESTNVKLRNVATGQYLGELRNNTNAKVTDVDGSDVNGHNKFAWTNINDCYAVFKDASGGDGAYAHMGNNTPKILIGYNTGDHASYWLVDQVTAAEALANLQTLINTTNQTFGTAPGLYRRTDALTTALNNAQTLIDEESTEVGGILDANNALQTAFAEANASKTDADIILPEVGKYYRFSYDFGNAVGVKYVQAVASGVTNKANAMVMTDDQGIASIFYYDGGADAQSTDDDRLVSYSTGLYVNESNRGLQPAGSDGGKLSFETAGLGKLKIKVPNYFHANQTSGDNPVYYVDHCGNDDGHATHNFIVEEVDMTLVTVKYMYKGAELTDLSVEKLVELGSTYTVANPYANKYVNVTCAVNGNRVEAVDGQWTVNVSQATSVIVTITEDLPFKTSTSFATANWQYLQMNSNNWKYMQTKEADNKTASVNVNSLGDRALWAFVGDALNGFKIWNKGAGEGYVLTVDAVTDETEAYMKENGTQVWTIEKGNGGFIIRQGTQECLNDFAGGSVMKIWNNSGAPTGRGSAFRTISGGVTDLADLCFPGIFTLQAERSPLLYDANAGEPTKLSSGMVSNIPANAKDSRQQFLISESDTDGLYYLYNVAAARFVDADLNFTDYPEPVLSFEPNPANPVFPWFVKIGGKYVVPGSNGEVNKIFHTSTPEDDDGKRYRIEKADEDLNLAMSVAYVIGYAEALLKDVNSLDNSKVYLVSTNDRGAWMYNDEEDALWSTRVADPNSADPSNPNWLPGSANSDDKAQQFAFLTVGGKTYLYSVGAGKFVVKSGDYTAYSYNPTQPVVLLPAAGNKFFPIVVAFVDGENQHHIGISNAFTPPVITNYNNLEDSGNKVDISEVGDLENSAEILAKMETYLIAQTLVPELQALIAKAGLALNYLLESDNKAALATAKTAAEHVLASGSYTAETLGEQITALTTALNNATLVSETTGFNNAYVYTFVSKRGWMVATEEDATVKSANEGATDEALHQWAVYKSANNNYYLYNIGKQQFMGFTNVQNEEIPFAATPQMTTLTFKKSSWEDYPIMFSVDNVGVVNNNDRGAMIYWNNGWNELQDDGNNHKVTIVGAVPSETLTDIKNAVVLFEAIDALQKALTDADNRLDDALGYYSCTAQTQTELDAIEEFLATATDAAEVNAKTARVNELIATFTLNMPETGKFYYIQSANTNQYLSNVKSNTLTTTADKSANNIFYFEGEGENTYLVAYENGHYVTNPWNIGVGEVIIKGTEKYKQTKSFVEGQVGKYALKYFSDKGDVYYFTASGTSTDAQQDNSRNDAQWNLESVTDLPLTIHSSGKSTYSAPVDLEIPDGVTVYYAKEQVGDSHIRMYPLTGMIPANTGVVVQGEGTVSFPITTGAAALENNLLKPVVEAKAVTPKDGNSVFIMATKNDVTGFYPLSTTNNTIGGHKSYLEIPSISAARLSIIWDDTETGIFETEGGEQNAEIYDLTGRRLDKPVKGINIIGGKLVIK